MHRLALFVLMMVALGVPTIAIAQAISSDQSDPAASMSTDEDVSSQPTPTEIPSRYASDLTSNVRSYLNMAYTTPSALYELESALTDVLRDIRLGVIAREPIVPRAMKIGPSRAADYVDRIRGIRPPPQFAAVHEMYIAAAKETKAAVDLTVAAFDAGESSIPPAAADHFSRSRELVLSAQLELDRVAGP